MARPLFRRLFALSLACLLAAPSVYAATNTSNNFTPAQKTQIQTIVHDYLLDNPQILIQVVQKLQKEQGTRTQEQAMKTIGTQTQNLFFDPNTPVAGNSKGNVTLIEFFDYQCSHCKEIAPTVATLMAADPNLRIVFKELPLFGEKSELASRAALAAQMQGKYVVFHTALMKATQPLTQATLMDIAKSAGLDVKKLQEDMNNVTITKELASNSQLATDLGVPGTPAFIIAPTPVNNVAPKSDKTFFIPGGASLEDLQKLVGQARKS